MSIKLLTSDKLARIVTIYILVQPLIDVLTTLTTSAGVLVSIGQLLRGLFMLAAFAYLLTQPKWRLPTIAIGGFMLLAVAVQLLTNQLDVVNITTLIKVFYLPLAVMFFYQFKNRLFSHKIYFYLLATYLILLIIPALVGLNLVDPVNYDGKIWFRGLFAAGNDIAAVLICLAPVVLQNMIRDKRWWLLAATSLLLIVAAWLVGTKAILIGLLATAVYLLISASRHWSKAVKGGVWGGLAGLVVAAAIALPLTPVYQNTLIALNYHGVTTLGDIVKPEIIDKVILSERLTFLDQTATTYTTADWSQKLFGLRANGQDITVESDPFDIFFGVGLVGSMVYIFWLICLCRGIDWRQISHSRRFSSIIMLALALLVGHVLITPAVATILALNFIRGGKQ
jgi:hypothetical protein